MSCGWRRRLHEISCRLTCSIEAAYLDVMPTSMNLGGCVLTRRTWIGTGDVGQFVDGGEQTLLHRGGITLPVTDAIELSAHSCLFSKSLEAKASLKC